jgi:hypothetical protein
MTKAQNFIEENLNQDLVDTLYRISFCEWESDQFDLLYDYLKENFSSMSDEDCQDMAVAIREDLNSLKIQFQTAVIGITFVNKEGNII